MFSLKTISSVSALALAAAFVAAPASAQQTIRGQGATLPAGLYVDWFNPSPVAGFTFSYNAPRSVAALTGSSAGKASFESHSFNNAGADFDVQYAGSDAILTAADLDAYDTVRWGQPIQLPSVGTPVTIAYNPAGLTRTRTGPTGLVSTTGTQTINPIIYLSRASYCGIFTGGITAWNHPRIVADNGVAPSTQPIKVVVRSDGSGTTEIFTRHLDTVCDGSAAAGGFSFPDTRPAGSAASVPPTGRTGGTTATGNNIVNWDALITPASRLIKAAGSGGVSTAIAANQFAIGYVSPDFTNVVATPAPGAGSPAPAVANLQNQADLTAGVNNNYTHSPAYPKVAFGLSLAPTPTITDSAIVWGQKLSLRQGGTTPTSVDPVNNPTNANAYPINGFTYLDFYTCYPAAKTAGVKNFIVTYFANATSGNADIEARAGGFAPLVAGLKTAVRNRANGNTTIRGISSGPITAAPACTL